MFIVLFYWCNQVNIALYLVKRVHRSLINHKRLASFSLVVLGARTSTFMSLKDEEIAYSPPFNHHFTHLRYLPHWPSRAGSRAACITAWAPCMGVFMNALRNGPMITRLMNELSIEWRVMSVRLMPGLTQLKITPEPEKDFQRLEKMCTVYQFTVPEYRRQNSWFVRTIAAAACSKAILAL